MARVIKDHSEHRQEFLDAARELFYTKGYNETSVNNILQKLDLSKGTFYHSFNFKEELLDELVEQLSESIVELVDIFINDPHIDAISKLNKVFETSSGYKAANKDLIITIMHTMYSDKNIRLRLKMKQHSVENFAPIMRGIIHQGINEGLFNTKFPDEIGELLYSMVFGLAEKAARLIMSLDEHPENMDKLIAAYDMFQDAMERLLGAPSGSIQIHAKEVLVEMFS